LKRKKSSKKKKKEKSHHEEEEETLRIKIFYDYSKESLGAVYMVFK
jgi:hypothetical protein